MWIPSPVYKRLPVLYGAAGLASMALSIRTPVVAMSSAVFFVAAALVSNWRYAARAAGPGRQSSADRWQSESINAYVLSVTQSVHGSLQTSLGRDGRAPGSTRDGSSGRARSSRT